jgi:ATP adenylyltransferase
MDRLWAPWRLEYVTSTKPEIGCVLCTAPDLPEQQPLIVFRGTTCYVMLNLYPYNNGHLMVVPYRHVATLAGMTPDELQELAILAQRSEQVLFEAYRPQGLNMGINLGKPAGAGILEHLHLHLVPRWTGDTNFMTIVGDTRVLPEALTVGAGRIRPIFERLARGG